MNNKLTKKEKRHYVLKSIGITAIIFVIAIIVCIVLALISSKSHLIGGILIALMYLWILWDAGHSIYLRLTKPKSVKLTSNDLLHHFVVKLEQNPEEAGYLEHLNTWLMYYVFKHNHEKETIELIDDEEGE